VKIYAPTSAFWRRVVLLAGLSACAPPQSEPTPDDTDTIGDTGVAPNESAFLALEQYDFLDEERSNHLLPSSVAIDSDNRLAYSFSLGFGNIAVTDLDTRTVRDVIEVNHALGTTSLVVDKNHYLWLMVAQSEQPLFRLDPNTGETQTVDLGLSGVAGLIPRTDGSVIIFGFSGAGVSPGSTPEESEPTMLVLNEALEVLSSTILPHNVQAVTETQHEEQFAIAVASAPPEVQIWSTTSLEQIGQCRLAMDPTAMTPLSNGNFALISLDQVGLATCDGSAASQIIAGHENKSVLAQGDGFLVLDRQSGDDLNWGEIRSYDADLNEVSEPTISGKNSGFGDFDIDTQLLWMNSEGTTELLAFDVQKRAFVDTVLLGKHVESLAPSPAEESLVVVTGRLSSTLAMLDLSTASTSAFEHDLTWPVSPCWVDDTIWVIDHLTSTLYAFSSETREQVAEYPYDGSHDTALTFADIKYHEARGTLFVTNGPDNRLLEIDPSTGEQLNNWALGGIPFVDENRPARLEILWDETRVFVVRGLDGRISRVDLETGETEMVSLLEGVDPNGAQLRVARMSDDQETLWVRGYAVDPDNLAFQSTTDDIHPVWSIAIGESDGANVAWRAPSSTLALMDAENEVLTHLVTDLSSHSMPEFNWLPEWDNTILMTDFEGARVLTWKVQH